MANMVAAAAAAAAADDACGGGDQTRPCFTFVRKGKGKTHDEP